MSEVKLSILIPYIKRHENLFRSLVVELSSQSLDYKDQVEILFDDHETDSTGGKRNRLLERGSGKYFTGFDADDRPASNYIQLLMEGIEKDVDCCSLKGIITSDGINPDYFEHSIRHDKYYTVENAKYEKGETKYFRFPNHISCIRADIAKQFKFPEKSWGEDTDWATLIHNSGLLKTEHYIDQVIYHYDYISDKTK